MPRRLLAALGQSRALRRRLPEYEALLARLGKHKTSKACLYVNKLADVDVEVLEEIVRRTWEAAKDIDQCAVC